MPFGKTTKRTRALQKTFLKRCVDTTQSLDEVMSDLNLPHETLAGWLTDRDFRVSLHAYRRYLRKARDLQVEIYALRASAMLGRVATETLVHDVKPTTRAACVDLIRLARDSRARVDANHPRVDDVTKHRSLYHPELPPDEAQQLIAELARRDAEEHLGASAATTSKV